MTVKTTQPPLKRIVSSYYVQISIVLLLLVITGFASRAIFSPERLPPARFTLFFHATLAGSWFIFVTAQAVLIKVRERNLHKRLGGFGTGLAVAIVISGIVMIVENNSRQFIWIQVTTNSWDMVMFSTIVTLGILNRKNLPFHRRMMIFSAIAMMSPPLARLSDALIGLPYLTTPIWYTLVATVFVFDWRTERKITRASIIGAAIIFSSLVVQVVTLVLTGPTELADAGAVSRVAAQEAVQDETQPSLANREGYTGRIRLVRFLDEPDGYCIDVPGAAGAVMLNLPPIAHTCHFDPLADQIFSFNVTGEGFIRWSQGEDEVCLTVPEPREGANLTFNTCGIDEMQSFDYTAVGEFHLRDTDLCLVVERTGPNFDETLSPDQDEYGRGRPVNPQYTHLARALQLDQCGQGDPSMARWQAYLE